MRIVSGCLFLVLALGSNAFGASTFVTLNPMVAEWSAEILGKEVVKHRMVAASEYSVYPEFLKSIPTIGPYPNIQIEKIVSLKPDLIIGSEEYNRRDQLDRLKQLGFKVAVMPKESFSKMESWIRQLGMALNEPLKAEKLANEWSQRIQKIQSNPRINLRKKRAMLLVQHEPLIIVGSNSFIHEAFEMVGIQNIFGDLHQSYTRISKEAVLAKKPDLIFYFDMIKKPDELARVQKTWAPSLVQGLNGDDYSRCSLRLLSALEGLQIHE